MGSNSSVSVGFLCNILGGLRNVKFPTNLESVDIVFSLLLMLNWDVHNNIPVDVLFSPLSRLF